MNINIHHPVDTPCRQVDVDVKAAQHFFENHVSVLMPVDKPVNSVFKEYICPADDPVFKEIWRLKAGSLSCL